jgi:nucleotide-binding universal stress UspA family protein
MHVLIATDGSLDAGRAAEFASRLAGADGTINVLTMVEINRNLLRDLRGLFGERFVEPTHQDAEYVSLKPNTGEAIGADWPGDEEMLTRYLEDQKVERTHELVAALDGAGVTADVQVREGEAASGIIAAATELGVDVVCVGSHGRGLFEGVLGSTSTKLARRCPVPILIIR